MFALNRFVSYFLGTIRAFFVIAPPVFAGDSTDSELFGGDSATTSVSMNGFITKELVHFGHLACLPMLVSLILNFDLQLGHCVFIRRMSLYPFAVNRQADKSHIRRINLDL